MNQIVKLGTVVAMAILMTACGGSSEKSEEGMIGGSSEESEEGIISSGDNGGSSEESEEGIISSGSKCIKIPVHPKLNVKYRSKITSGQETLFVINELLKWNKNSYEGYYISLGVKSENKTQSYTKNNYHHFTKSEGKDKLENGEIVSKGSTVSHDPYTRIPSGKVCKGQSWVDAFKWSTTSTDTNGKKSTAEKNQKQIYIIEDIDVLKTVEAGEFSTFVYTMEENITENIVVKHKVWVDIKTGWDVYSETMVNGSEEEGNSEELIELIR